MIDKKKETHQLLWIGSLEEDNEFIKKVKNGFDQTSAQVAQKGLISGIEHIVDETFDSINGSVVQPYPKYREKKVRKIFWSHKKNACDVSVSFRNIKYLNRILCKKAMIAEAKNWIRDNYKGGELTIFAYSMRSAPINTAVYIKRRIPNSKIVLIVTDLPEFMDLGQSKIKYLLKAIDWQSIKMSQPKIDKFVLYAEKMADYLSIPAGKWMLMEGFYNPGNEIIEYIEAGNKQRNAIFYSGMLSLQYGLNLLLDSFMRIEDPQAELWLAGSGNAEDYINQCCCKDKRIEFYGLLPRDEVIRKQKQAIASINMRLPSNPVSKYSFPSKLFEYMTSGNPTLSFELEGIPKEYYPLLVTISSQSELTDTLKKVLSMSTEQRKEIGNSARMFILEHKSVMAQCKRICQFVW